MNTQTDQCQRVSVSGMLFRDGKLLIVRRAPTETFLPGVFEFPGGKVHFGESPLAATKREFKEETQLDVTARDLIGVRSYLSRQGRQHIIELFYLVTDEDQPKQIILSQEHDAYWWITVQDLETVGWTSHDPVKTLSHLLFEQKNRFETYDFPCTIEEPCD